MINDGTGLTAYTVAGGVVGVGTFALGESLLEFVVVALGGAAIGTAIGWLATLARRHTDHSNMEIAIALLTAYASSVLADQAGVSGVLGAVAAGLVVQRSSESISGPSTRLQSLAFWEIVTFLLNVLLFLLVGLQFSSVVDGIEGSDTGRLVLSAAAVGGGVVALRMAWMLTMTPFVARAAAEDEPPDRRLLRREQVVMGWSGMRGALSLAAALAVPLEAGEAPFPGRSLLIFLTYTTILLTLVLPALTLPALLRRLWPSSDRRAPARDDRGAPAAGACGARAARGACPRGRAARPGPRSECAARWSRPSGASCPSCAARVCRPTSRESSSETWTWRSRGSRATEPVSPHRAAAARRGASRPRAGTPAHRPPCTGDRARFPGRARARAHRTALRALARCP